ncbi:testis-specific serine/threonine-protein kinase 3-like [Oppia nitens]|uniref:testis-specific serine/threonine-protein kinase 3-like n=1 Tax=Oppia nitens TaxID=1686743 RepID=UPI0023DBB24A|nr:testis-specific serine/threonine-protein kinase 3-like [Oppia nitens]
MVVKPGDKYICPTSHEERLRENGFTITSVINSGKFGVVCSVKQTITTANNTNNNTNNKTSSQTTADIAVKIIDLSKTSENYRKKMLPKELKALEVLRHEFITQIIRIILLTNTMYVFMEKADGDVLDLLQSKPDYAKGLPEPMAKQLYKCMAKALEYIHGKGWAHRDMKCENILVNKEASVAKITDFGVSTSCLSSSGERLLKDTYCGSPQYMAPEMIKNQPYDAMKSDIWSTGVILYVMINNLMPFSPQEINGWLRQPPTNASIAATMKSKSSTTSKDCLDLIGKQIDVNLANRISIQNILQHKWLNN